MSTLPIIAPPTPLETVSIRPDRWLSIEKWFMGDIESLSLDEKETPLWMSPSHPVIQYHP